MFEFNMVLIKTLKIKICFRILEQFCYFWAIRVKFRKENK